MKKQLLLIPFLFIAVTDIISAQEEQFNSEEKPWVWWYWMGSAVSKSGIDYHLENFKKLGFGGANVTATYGVDGFEGFEIPYMSRSWIEMINYTAKKANEEGLKIDVSLSSAWPFGGPDVTSEMAAKYSNGGRLFAASKGRTIKKISCFGTGSIEALSAYSEKGDYINLMKYVGSDGILDYAFPEGIWDVYGLYSAGTMQNTKRSGPGGEGLVLDHFNSSAVSKYLEGYDTLFSNGTLIRSTFNDSYEVYGADYTPSFLEEFRARRGYKLEEHLNLLFSEEKTDAYFRVRCDYRETISDLLLENFVCLWSGWARSRGLKTVEQAHGAPANLLDLYAASDIPQTESFGASKLGIPGIRIDNKYNENVFGRPEKLVMKFASSASNIKGKRLTSSESATWLGDHFKVALSQVKPQVDELFTSGINHVMLTCAAYSPDTISFPGWLFYAASNFGPTTAFIDCLPDFSKYISRIQKRLQNSKPDNEVLLYMPVYDLWSEGEDEDGRSKLIMFTVHNSANWLYKNDFGETARNLRLGGFDFDYISDRQIMDLEAVMSRITTSEGAHYKALVIPGSRRIPVNTMAKLMDLAEKGIPVVFAYRMPGDVPGFAEVDSNRLRLSRIRGEMKALKSVYITDKYTTVLQSCGLTQETFDENNLSYIRKTNEMGTFYFVANQGNNFHEGWIELGKGSKTATLYDPLSDKKGLAKIKGKKVFLQLEPGESCFIELYGDTSLKNWDYFHEESGLNIDGEWKVTFINGSPTLPESFTSEGTCDWITAPDTMARYFSGTGRYESTFNLPRNMKGKADYRLLLGQVRESAKVWINDVYMGQTWCVPFEIDVDPSILKSRSNKLRIEVRNLDANRMIWTDKNNPKWQKFFFVDVSYSNFDASGWEPEPSGLPGPVKLICSDLNSTTKTRIRD